ncbi:MAG: hypothetical protein ACR2MD_07095 [Aridibacter sp.]
MGVSLPSDYAHGSRNVPRRGRVGRIAAGGKQINDKYLYANFFSDGFYFYIGNIDRFCTNTYAVAKSFADEDGNGNGNADAFADTDTKTIAEKDGNADGYENADEYAVANADTDCAGRRRSE